MKKYEYITIIAVLFLIYLNSATAQFSIQTGNNWFTGASNVDRLSIGTSAASFPAVLYVDGANTFNSNTGDVFSTNGPSTNNQTWRMLKNGIEYGQLFNGSGSSNFSVQATNNHLNLLSGNSGTGIEAIRIVGGAGINARFVGIGNYASANFSVAHSQLHQWITGNSNVYHQFSNGNTTATDATKGFKIGLTFNVAVSDAELISQQNGANMNFYTNNATTVKRMTILSGGNVGIGTATPGARLHAVTTNTAGGANIDGTKIDLTNTSGSQSPVNNGVHVTSTITNTLTNDGVLSEVNGGNTCIGYKAVVDNTNTIPSSNYGFSATITDHGTTAATTNTGFLVGIVNSTAPTLNRGFVSALGGGTYSQGTMYGMVINDQNAENNTGILINCTKTLNTTATGNLYGINATCGVSDATVTNSYGGSFTAGGGTNITYGVWATGGNNCMQGGGCSGAAGYFSGPLYSTGNLVVSDGFLKGNITPVSNGLSIINQLNPKTFTFKTQLFPSMHMEPGTHFGLLAANVGAVLPSLVHELAEPAVLDSLGNVIYPQINFKAVNYTELIAILIAGMKEQQAQISALQTQVDGCCASPRSAAPNTGSIDLENVNTLQLMQNDPNPFHEFTTIRWNIPGEFQNAVIYFYDNNGNQVNTYTVNSGGSGELEIFGSSLSSGTYHYMLVVDGKVVDSKKMVKTN